MNYSISFPPPPIHTQEQQNKHTEIGCYRADIVLKMSACMLFSKTSEKGHSQFLSGPCSTLGLAVLQSRKPPLSSVRPFWEAISFSDV